VKKKTLHIIGGGIAGAITALAWKRKFDNIYLYEKQSSLFQFASSRNAAILRSYESDVCISNIVKLSLLEFLKLQEKEKNIVSLCGLWLKPHEIDYYLQDFKFFLQKNDFSNDYNASFLELLHPQKENLSNIFSVAANDEEGVLIKGNGVISLDFFLLHIQSFIENLQQEQKLTIFYNSQVKEFVLDKENILFLGIEKNKKNSLNYEELNYDDVVVEATGSWAGSAVRYNIRKENSSDPEKEEGEIENWRPPITAYKRHLYNLELDYFSSIKNFPVIWDETKGFYLKQENYFETGVKKINFLATNCDEKATRSGDYEVNKNHQSLFEEQIKKQYSFLEKARVVESRACLRTFALDERPIIGFDPFLKNLFWVAGLGGKGMSMSLGLIKWMEKFTLKNIDDFPHNPFSCYRFI